MHSSNAATSLTHFTAPNAIHRPSPLHRTFATTPIKCSWLIPKAGKKYKDRKGRPQVRTGGSTKGTTVIWGDYGLRMTDKGRRLSAASLKIGEETIRKRLRGMKFRLYMRIVANIGVYTSGNDQRMGKGKGGFDYWATRVAVSRVLFELSGDLHEQVVRDAFRLAGNKLPGECWATTMVTGSTANKQHNRHVRVREEGRSASHGHYKNRQWCYRGLLEAASKSTCISNCGRRRGDDPGIVSNHERPDNSGLSGILYPL